MNKKLIEWFITALEWLRDRTKNSTDEITIDDIIRFIDNIINVLKLLLNNI